MGFLIIRYNLRQICFISLIDICAIVKEDFLIKSSIHLHYLEIPHLGGADKLN